MIDKLKELSANRATCECKIAFGHLPTCPAHLFKAAAYKHFDALLAVADAAECTQEGNDMFGQSKLYLALKKLEEDMK